MRSGDWEQVDSWESKGISPPSGNKNSRDSKTVMINNPLHRALFPEAGEITFDSHETKPQMVAMAMDLNMSFQGLALIQGQSYNPEKLGGVEACKIPF